MRVLLACPYAWDAPGGVQVHVRQLASKLRDRGHQVLVVAPGDGEAEEPWVRIVGWPIRVPYRGTVAPVSPWPATARRVHRALRDFGPDVVHAHEPLVPSVSMFAARSARSPVVATFHAFSEHSLLFDLAAPAVRPVWRRLAVRIAVSGAAASFVSRRLRGEVRVVPNGIETALFAKAEPASGLPDGRRLLWVNRLDPQKGFGVAVEAFARLVPELTDLTLVVAGDGPDRSAVDGLEAGVRDRVVMLGTVPHEQLPPYHAAADAFVSPAAGQESFGIALVEAMAAGLPVVATDIAGYREVARDGIEAVLVPPDDPDALAEALRRVVTDPELARRLGDAGRQRAAEFDWGVVVGRIERAYQEAIAKGPVR